METEGHRALKYNLPQKKTHSSWLTILISPLIHQIPQYVELLPGTLISPPFYTVPQTLGSSQTCNEGGRWTVRAEAAMLLLYTSHGLNKGDFCAEVFIAEGWEVTLVVNTQ